MTEDSKTVGDAGQSEDGEDESTSLSDPSEEQPMGKVEAVEGKQEVTAAQPARRASTSNPPNLPVKLLTRLGSLDSECDECDVKLHRCVQQRLTLMIIPPPNPRCTSSASEEVPSHPAQELHTTQRPSWLAVERQDVDTNWVPPPWGTTLTAAP